MFNIDIDVLNHRIFMTFRKYLESIFKTKYCHIGSPCRSSYNEYAKNRYNSFVKDLTL